jgi:hypothetical protein
MTSDNHIDPEAFGTEIERMEQITNIDWDEIFRDVDELTPKGYYVRMILSSQIRYGSSQWAHDTRYTPALKIPVEDGQLEADYNDDGDPIVKQTATP